MVGNASVLGFWRQVRATTLAIAVFMVLMQVGNAQNSGPLSGGNEAQQSMGQSINAFCPPLHQNAITPGNTLNSNQNDLSQICSAMIGNALQLQGRSSNGLGSYGLSESGLNGALQNLNGGAELLIPTSQASVAQTTQTSRQTGTIEERLKELRELNTGVMVAGSGPPQARQIASLNGLEPGGQVLLAQNQAPALAYSIGRLGLFATGLGQFGNRDLTTSENGYSFNNAGFIAGGDYRITPELIAGLAFGYTHSNTNFDTSAVSASGQSLRGNLFQGNLYATYFPTDRVYVNGIALIGGGNTDSQRHIVIPSNDPSTPSIDRNATGSFGSRIAGFTLASGYSMPIGGLVLTPIARFLYQHTSVDSFSENGAQGANLRYGSSSVDTVLSFLGADATYPFQTPFGIMFPTARFHWAHQYSPNNTTVSVAYSNDPSPTLLSAFILPGTPTDKNYFDLGVGVSMPFSRMTSAYVNYDAIVGISHTTYNSIISGTRFSA